MKSIVRQDEEFSSDSKPSSDTLSSSPIAPIADSTTNSNLSASQGMVATLEPTFKSSTSSQLVEAPPQPSSSPSSSSHILDNPTTVIDHSNNATNNGSAVIDPHNPASRLIMIKPKLSQANPSLFAIGSTVVFEWVFDIATLMFPPVSLNIEATLASDPLKVWSIANVSGTTTSVTWDTASVNNTLFMGFYILYIYESSAGKHGVASSGHLLPYSDLRFGLYVPGVETPKTDGKYCATCHFSTIDINSFSKSMRDLLNLVRLTQTALWSILAFVLAVL
ncbi:hypothetical protein BGZ51_006473 [Haplosporangium sp. Z 767]|nr:hypothetical protein BGZ50_003548 [Haplosporangium sp. Z 11]KAF9191915.1 hypothetical protein BGZ51_006473 [Haplosporangium sp. Z 767]